MTIRIGNIMSKLIVCLLAFIPLASMAASNEIVSGEFVSLDGKYQHDFKSTGDYWGKVALSDSSPEVEGVFEQGSEICWRTQQDGSKGATGNVLYFVGEVQCCLEIRQISDKFAVTKIAVVGTGTGYALCNNQVLRKNN